MATMLASTHPQIFASKIPPTNWQPDSETVIISNNIIKVDFIVPMPILVKLLV